MKLQIMTIKDIQAELGVSFSYARTINANIKNEYNLATKITKEHLIRYFKLDGTVEM